MSYSNSSLCSSSTAGTPSAKMESESVELHKKQHTSGEVQLGASACVCVCVCVCVWGGGGELPARQPPVYMYVHQLCQVLHMTQLCDLQRVDLELGHRPSQESLLPTLLQLLP